VFERFTDRARRVLVLAQEEARLLNHSFIGTEHLLLGLIQEGDGLAAKALQSLGISLQAAREKVEDTIGPAGSHPTGSPPFTPRAKKVMELALREALQLGHHYIGTEHLLLGLVREGEGVAAQVLRSLGADLVSVRQKVMELLTGSQGQESADLPRGVGEFPLQIAGADAALDPRYPYKLLAGPERTLGSTSLGLRIVGVLLFDDGIRVTWRLHGVPGAVTRLVHDATRGSREATSAPMRPEIRRLVARARAEQRDVEPYVLISDDLGTAFSEIETTFRALANGEWAGNCDFAPALPEAASTLAIAWENDSINLSL
jgi:hypothetical protein